MDDLNIVGRIFTLTLKEIRGVTMWTELIWLKIGTIAMQVTHDVCLQVRKLLDSRVGVTWAVLMVLCKCLTCEWSGGRGTQTTVHRDTVTTSVEEREGKDTWKTVA